MKIITKITFFLFISFIIKISHEFEDFGLLKALTDNKNNNKTNNDIIDINNNTNSTNSTITENNNSKN
jgi:hypothetical protein